MPTPTPISTCLVLGCVLGEGVVLVTAGEEDSPDDVDGMEDASRVELVERKELVVGIVVEA